MSGCQHPSANHSSDSVIVHHGCPHPVSLCGFHATWPMTRVIAAIRAADDHDCQANFAALRRAASSTER